MNVISPENGVVTLGLLCAAALCLVGISFLVLRYSDRRRRALRLFLNALSVITLFLFVLRPHVQADLETTEAILITAGASLEQLRTFSDTSQAQLPVFSLGKQDRYSGFSETREILDLNYLSRNHPEISVLHVFGFGLPYYDWEANRRFKITYHRSPLEAGVKAVHWRSALQLGETLEVSGSVSDLGDQAGTLRLSGPGGVADSVVISPNVDARFLLRTTPRDTGRYVYRMTFGAGAGMLVEREIGVSVTAAARVRLLVLADAPSFEVRYLKNWLAEHNGGLALRTAISQDRYRFEFLNVRERDLKLVTRELLANFDLVLIDGRTVMKLNNREVSALRAAISQAGLGMLLLADEALFAGETNESAPGAFFHRAAFTEVADMEHRVVRLKLNTLNDSTTTDVWAAPFEIESAPGIKPIIQDMAGGVMVAAFSEGKGLVGTSLIRNTYRWILADKAEYHSAYWSHVLSELTRPAPKKPEWRIGTTGPLFMDQPLDVQFTGGSNPKYGLITNPLGGVRKIFLRQSVNWPARWSGTFWPREKGWHAIYSEGTDKHWFYVSGRNAWPVWQQAAKQQSTRRMAMRAGSSVPSSALLQTTNQPIALIWLFMAFLIINSLLWIERKL